MKDEFTKIRLALEEHLSAINENTAEIQVLFDYLNEMELKIEKLSQRLDTVQLNFGKPPEKISITPLNQEEKKVFLVLYTEEIPLTYSEIAVKALIPSAVISECISSLSQKGIPFIRTFVNNQMFFKLDPQFKELQAKENLINLSLESFMG